MPFIMLLTACAAEQALTQTALSVDFPTTMPAASPSGTATAPVTPTASGTPTPSRTPKPTPTLPTGADFECLPPDGQRTSAVVAGVIDGDTIKVQIGVQSFTVRYLGIDTPETNVQPPERMGPEATARNREIVAGRRVTLVSDPEAGDTDIYDRLLRFVIVDDIMVNVTLVREGLARYYAGENACGALIFAAQNEARSADVGLWAPETGP